MSSKHSFFVTAVEIHHNITIRDHVGGSKQFFPRSVSASNKKAELIAKWIGETNGRLLSACSPVGHLCRYQVANESGRGTLSVRWNDVRHWAVEAVFVTCLVGAEIALYSGLPLVPPKFVFLSNRIGLGGSLLISLLLSIALLYACSHA
jgi:hypothetical protein